MSKPLRKAIMTRSRLKNIFNKCRNESNWMNYKQVRNKCVNILRESKKNYFKKLNVKSASDSKTFWSTMKPFGSHKSTAMISLYVKMGK